MANRADFHDQPRPNCPDRKSPGQLDGLNFWQPAYRLGDKGHGNTRWHGNNRGYANNRGHGSRGHDLLTAKTPSEQFFVALYNKI